MRQNDSAFKNFMDENPNFYTPYQQTIIQSFQPARDNGFSEFMLTLGQGYSFHRLFVDPFSRVMFSEYARGECGGSIMSTRLL